MSRLSPTLPRAILAAVTMLQGALGVGAFVLHPQGLFPEIGGNPLASLCLRLAAHTNLSVVVFTTYVLLRRRDDGGLIRVLLSCQALYHALAGAETMRLSWLKPYPDLVEPARQPLVFHWLMMVILGACAWKSNSD